MHRKLRVGLLLIAATTLSCRSGSETTRHSASSLTQLPLILSGQSKRVSSWDQTGQNRDNRRIGPGETAVLADIKGSGQINHIYLVMVYPDPMDYRDAVLRMFWDGEKTPSVEVPLGDFFCVSNCTPRRFQSLLAVINPGMDAESANNGLNVYFPMPFSNGARIEIENQGPNALGGAWGCVWYHIDYQQHDRPPGDELGRFHAQWRRTRFTGSRSQPRPGKGAFPGLNRDGKANYVMLDAAGEGHVAGLFLEVDNIQGGWWGEGDDMIFVDGEPWPPSLHGTGTEEIFGGGACPHREYSGPYTGFLLVENLRGERFRGKNGMYRWYVQDPIRFRKSIRMTIEHGHDNDFDNDYSSVVYWYQKEPHAAFPKLPPRDSRRPIYPEAYWEAHAKFVQLNRETVSVLDAYSFEGKPLPAWIGPVREKLLRGYALLSGHEYERAHVLFEQALRAAPGGSAAPR
jgi:hypothetical protein